MYVITNTIIITLLESSETYNCYYEQLKNYKREIIITIPLLLPLPCRNYSHKYFYFQFHYTNAKL